MGALELYKRMRSPVGGMAAISGSSEHGCTYKNDPRKVIPFGSLQVLGRYLAGIWKRYLTLSSRGQGVDAGYPEQIGELLAGIKHPGFHRALRDTDDLADLFHRFLVIIDEVDDLAVRR